MKTKKILAGTLVAGTAMFFLAWLAYGIVLMDYFENNFNKNGTERPMDQMVWGSLVASYFVSGFLSAAVLYWTGTVTLAKGALIGAILGCSICLAFDLNIHAMSTMYKNTTAILVDVISYGIIFSISSAAAAFVMGKIKK